MDQDDIKDSVDEQRLQQTQGISNVSSLGPTQATGAGVTSGSQGVFVANYANPQGAEAGANNETSEVTLDEQGDVLSDENESFTTRDEDESSSLNDEDEDEDEDESGDKTKMKDEDTVNLVNTEPEETDKDSDSDSDPDPDPDPNEETGTETEGSTVTEDNTEEVSPDSAPAPGEVIAPTSPSGSSDPVTGGGETAATGSAEGNQFVGAATSDSQINTNDDTPDGDQDNSEPDNADVPDPVMTADADADPVNELIEGAFSGFSNGDGGFGDVSGSGEDD